MRTTKLYTLSAVAGLLPTGVAHADDSALFGQGGYAGQSTRPEPQSALERKRCASAPFVSNVTAFQPAAMAAVVYANTV